MVETRWKQHDSDCWMIELKPHVKKKFEDLFIQGYKSNKPHHVDLNDSHLSGVVSIFSLMTLNAKKLTINTSGKNREIYSPTEETKFALRLLLPFLNEIFSRLEQYKVAYGFIPKRSCVEQAKQHIGYRYTISLDIKDFFDSIRPELVKEYIEHDLISLLFLNGAPRQGFPTSPVVSNIAFNAIDVEIIKYLNSALIKQDDLSLLDTSSLCNYRVNKFYSYTRYADDLSISINDSDDFNLVTNGIEAILNKFGFELNLKKTKILYAKNGRRIICGVSVDDSGIYPTRKTIKKIRAAIHQERFASLLGLRAWAYSIEKSPSD